MKEKESYKINDYLKRYNNRTLDLKELRELWINYGRDLPQVDLCPMTDRPSERQYEDSFRKYLENLVSVGIIEEIYISGRGK